VEWRSIPFDKLICEGIKEGRFEKGTNTGTCRFFCDPHNACVSPFQGTTDLSAAVLKVESWAMMPANSAWAAGSSASKSYDVLRQIMPSVTKIILDWKPYFDNIQTLSTTENRYTQGLCVANLIFVVSNLITNLEAATANSQPAANGTTFASPTLSESIVKSSCLVSYVLVSCSYQLGIDPASFTAISALSAT
jgi:hypothetical protein